MTETSDTDQFVCSDCGTDLLRDGFLNAVCKQCGGINPQTRRDYEAAAEDDERRDYAAYSGDGEFVVADEENPNAWVCADVAESAASLMEVRQ
jgi:hypothetical protein